MNSILALQALPIDREDEATDAALMPASTVSNHCTNFVEAAE